jgi:hypothetical protein
VAKTLSGVLEVEASEHKVALDSHALATFLGNGARSALFVKSPASYTPHEHAKSLSNNILFRLLDC